MKLKKIAFALAGFGALAFGIAACSKPAPAPAAAPTAESMPADSSNMATPMTPTPAPTGPVEAVGVVTAVDAAAGTVTLDHEAINAISWPAMKMQFKAEDPSILKGITPGEHVAFQLKSAQETGTVTMIKKQ